MKAVEPVVKAFVSEGALSEVVVKIIDDSVIDHLAGLGFVSVLGTEMVSLTVSSHDLKARIFERLRDEGVCFSSGPGWCPSDVFEFLREQEMLSGFYRKIMWDGPGKFRVAERC
ncbi:hypothetical protein [Pseudomonas cichorii]|uniref:hypothetical protein n=1 Tax=Pseudomonas cichorii TaxID=36746 RepID=UPI001C87A2D7|nr:hypothetical protein [Pseudomonas cichorii]MBX8497924.1 hypothetical protein [Pseudomonas cichorii]MBX8547688.1 hypothetical protein [Pseudomonas cichorii]MBX8600341.1 hypothetical protein [Pseudomonas cichorii]